MFTRLKKTLCREDANNLGHTKRNAHRSLGVPDDGLNIRDKPVVILRVVGETLLEPRPQVLPAKIVHRLPCPACQPSVELPPPPRSLALLSSPVRTRCYVRTLAPSPSPRCSGFSQKGVFFELGICLRASPPHIVGKTRITRDHRRATRIGNRYVPRVCTRSRCLYCYSIWIYTHQRKEFALAKYSASHTPPVSLSYTLLLPPALPRHQQACLFRPDSRNWKRSRVSS